MPWFIGDRQGDAYDAYFEGLAATGQDVHGEAAFVEQLRPRSVLDAGCGTGRVARELARRGLQVVGVDVDANMIETARSKAPEMEWQLADLTSVNLHRAFDVIVMAGNVMIFLVPGTEEAVLANMARHLAPDGLLVAGFQTGFPLTFQTYDALAEVNGLQLRERWATWNREPWSAGGRYAVSVHRLNDRTDINATLGQDQSSPSHIRPRRVNSPDMGTEGDS
jgi:SAM-dependent methyltransferase